MSNMERDDWKKLAEGAVEMLTEQAQRLADQSVLLAKKAADKAKSTAKLAVVNANLSVDRRKFQDAAKRLGRKYFELHQEDPEPEFLDEVLIMIRVQAAIEALEAEAAAMKNPAPEEPAATEAASAAPVVSCETVTDPAEAPVTKVLEAETALSAEAPEEKSEQD